MKRLAAAVAVGAAVLLGGAGPAAAHAQLASTEPDAGAALEQAPRRVVLRFDEPVEASLGAIRVFDRDGRRLDAGRAFHPDGRGAAVALDLPRLGDGTYVVAWRVASADSHPVHGAFTFRVGAAGEGDDTALVRRLLAAEGGDVAVGALYGAVRFLAFAALVVLVGGVAFVLVLWRAGAASAVVRRVVTAAWATAVVATAAGIGLQGAYAGGLDVADAVRPSVVRAVLDTRFGRVWAARLVVLAIGAPVLVLLGRRLRAGRGAGLPLVGAAAVLGVALLATPGLAGHAGAGSGTAVAEIVDVVHLAAASMWLGGLVLLVVAFLPGAEAETSVVPRFSRLAFGAVAVVAATGLLQGWRQVGSVDALTDTTYGRLLVVKVAVFAGMVGVAALSRRWVRRRLAASPQLRRSVAAETLLGVTVLAVTALLVNTVPAKSALAQPYSTEIDVGTLLVDVTVDPAKAGSTDVHVYVLGRTGAVTDVAELTAELRLPARGIGPLDVSLERAGPGHFAAYGFELPVRGTWRLDIVVRLTEFDQVRGSTAFAVR